MENGTELMNIYVVPALLALIFKLFILIYARRNTRSSASLLVLISVLACHNAIELIGCIRFLDGQGIAALSRGYYVATVLMLATLPIHAQLVSGTSSKFVVPLIAALALSVSSLIMFSDLIVAGYTSIGYTVTAVVGPYFFVFSLFVLFCLSLCVLTLIAGVKSAKTAIAENRCLYSLLAFSPLILVSLLALLLKVSGASINGAGIIPVATSIFLYILLKSEAKHQLTDIRRFLPLSQEKRSANEFLRLMDQYAQSDSKANAFSELREGIERQAVLYSLAKCDDNITKAAEMMGVQNRSTLYSMMRRLEIDHTNRQTQA